MTYMKQLAEAEPTEGARPFPRRQDLDQSKLIIGRPPKRRTIAVSHGWDTAFHVSPSGGKLGLIVDALQRLGADSEEDGVFLDVRTAWPGPPSCGLLTLPPTMARVSILSLLSSLSIPPLPRPPLYDR